ncbi:ATP11-domain-containing protein [Dentipellis sp. KUC8613]|nr:ATP11-domain-containing protein [Dentipellis sp. KUC8613]
MSFLPRARLLPLRAGRLGTNAPTRCFSNTFIIRNTDYTSKYAEKLQKRAQEEGATVEDLRARIKEQEQERSKQRLAAAAEAAARSSSVVSEPQASGSTQDNQSQLPPGASVRKDSSPVKPLSSYLNLERFLQTPHTAAQINALWTAYHASRSQGTGRGFICASLPRSTYETMLNAAQKYPSFVVPVPRAPSADETDASQKGYEFYFMQWAFHEAPPVPTVSPPSNSPFPTPAPPPPPPSAEPNPRTATILFTPLLEYKLRQTFATPYLVLTFYPDLASSHDVVLLRGEITPAVAKAAAPDAQGDYLLSQQDAQLLALAVQKFFLWGGPGSEEREALLKAFHEQPENFKWEELLKHGDV